MSTVPREVVGRTQNHVGSLVAATVAGLLGAGAIEAVVIQLSHGLELGASEQIVASMVLHGGLALVLTPFVVALGYILRLIEKWSRPVRRTVAVLVAAATVVLVPTVVVVVGHFTYYRGIILSAIDYRPLYVLAIVGALIIGLYLLLRRMWALRPLFGPIAVVALAAVVGWGVVDGSSVAGGIERLANEGLTAAPLSRGLRSIADHDRDGFPMAFCAEACDCNDADDSIHPAATEVPDNGLDEDCFEGDLRIPLTLATVSAPTKDDAAPTVSSTIELNRPNVLLITIDTLRADHLGCYGYERDTSPNLDALAEQSVLFEQNRAQGPMTRFSIPSILTGRYFSELERTGGAWPVLLEENTTIAEVLSADGYRTWAFHSIGYLMPLFGMNQGFDVYDVSTIKRRDPVHWNPTSDLVTDTILAHFDAVDGAQRADEPWFVWAYYADPHSGYIRHDGLPSFGPTIFDLYDQEILFTDLHIGRMLKGLKKRGELENTIIVVVSDHGEGLDPDQDHGFQYHGQTLFDNLLKTPLIIYVPGVQPRRVETPVGNIDVLPTLLELTDNEMPQDTEPIRGVSLVPFLRGDNPQHPPVFSEKVTTNVLPQKSMVRWPYKIIWKLGVNRFELYDLEEDPNELEDLAKSQPKVLADMKAHIQVWRSTVLDERKARERETN